jgi:capsular exopolysaccharide synthesis family protein
MHPNSQQPGPSTQAALVARPPSAAPPRRSDYVSKNPYGFDYTDDASEGHVIFDYWRIVRRNKRTILLASLAGLIMTVAICIPMKPVYRAQTTLEVLGLNQDFMNMKESSPTTTNDGSYETSEESTQAKLLQGATLTKRVFDKLLPGFSAELAKKSYPETSGWRAWFNLAAPAPLTPRELLVLKAANSLKVRETAHTRVLEATVDSTDPQLAADYANTLAHEFIVANAEERWHATQISSDWLSRELDGSRDKLRHSEDALQAYARQSGIILTDDTTNVATEKLQQIQQELSSATADRIAKQSRFELAQNSPPESLADVLNDPSLRETQSKINDLNRQIADLSAVFNPEYSKVRRLKAELDSAQEAFAQERSEILSRIHTDYLESESKERLLDAAYQTQIRAVTGQGEKTIQYNILKRDVDSNRQLYDTMLQQMKQSSIASAMHASNVRIVDAADVPGSPVFPNFIIASAIGLLAGLFLSSVMVIVRDQLDRTLQQPGDIKQWVELSELGAIPNASLQTNNKSYARLHAKLPEATPPPERQIIAKIRTREPVESTTGKVKPAMLSEAAHSVLTSILFMGDAGSCPRTLLFTSANAADGKTTVVSNIALAAAEIRMKVLIIDADLRRPQMHQIFTVANERGLEELLRADLETTNLASYVKPTHTPNLDLLTAGQPTNGAAHLLYSPNMGALIKKFAAEYDMVLIDSPPMLQMTDARILGRQADAVVLVARAGHTSRDALTAVKDRFEEDRIPVLGSILNNWDPSRASTNYYGAYSDTYRYPAMSRS